MEFLPTRLFKLKQLLAQKRYVVITVIYIELEPGIFFIAAVSIITSSFALRMATLSPLVYWSQSKKNLSIKIDLKDVKGPNIKLEKTTLEFESKGVGSEGPQNYGFSLTFYTEINTEESSCKIEDGKVCFNIVKAKASLWPRLTTKHQTPTWLKEDFNQPTSEDGLIKTSEKTQVSSTKADLTKTYLITYNLVMFVCYLYVASIMAVRFFQDGIDSFSGAHEAVGATIKYLHILQLSEILLAVLGVTTGDFTTLLMQLSARLVLIFTIIDAEPKLHTEPVIFYVYLVWVVVELVRYPFYITQVCKREVFAITWLRYTIWIFSLSLGGITEFMTIYKSMFYLGKAFFTVSKMYRLLLLISLPPLICNVSYHMYQARKKKLGSKKVSKVK